MRVKELMTQDVKTCEPDDSLAQAAGIMWQNDCGCVPVIDRERRVLGMLTDRDICMASWMQGKAAHELPVRLPMSKSVWACRPTDGLEVAERLMREKRVRRLPVVDADNRLVGILSLNDIVRRAQTTERGREPAELSDREIRETLAAVGSPRTR